MNHLNGSAVFYNEYLERNKKFKVAGQEFAMPRRLTELLHYEQQRGNSRDWVNRVFAVQASKFHLSSKNAKPFCRVQGRLRPNKLRRLALEFKRGADIEAFNAKLRQDSCENSDKINYKHLREICKSEEIALHDRRKFAEKIDMINLGKQKYA